VRVVLFQGGGRGTHRAVSGRPTRVGASLCRYRLFSRCALECNCCFGAQSSQTRLVCSAVDIRAPSPPQLLRYVGQLPRPAHPRLIPPTSRTQTVYTASAPRFNRVQYSNRPMHDDRNYSHPNPLRRFHFHPTPSRRVIYFPRTYLEGTEGTFTGCYTGVLQLCMSYWYFYAYLVEQF